MTVFRLAAKDSPENIKDRADDVLPGVDDHEPINAALSCGGTVELADGNYKLGGSMVMDQKYTTLVFHGARVVWRGVPPDTPILHMKESQTNVIRPRLVGSGPRGNGIGILLLRETGGAHNCRIESPRIYDVDVGIEFGIVGKKSTGDNLVQGGLISQAKTGVLSKGFTNWMMGVHMDQIDVGIHCTADRIDQRIEVYSSVIAGWQKQAIRVDRGDPIFTNIWMENVAPSEAKEAILIQDGRHLRFAGNTRVLLMNQEECVIRAIDTVGLRMDALHLAHNSQVPDRIFIEEGGSDNVIEKALVWPDGKRLHV